MLVNLEIKNSVIYDAFKAVISSPAISGSCFVTNLRHTLSMGLIEEFSGQGLIFNPSQNIKNINTKKSEQISAIANTSDLQFCLRYGAGEYSVSALNYLNQGRDDTLKTLLTVGGYSIGSLAFAVENGDYKISIAGCPSLLYAGYTYDIAPRNRRSNFCIWGITFDKKLLDSKFGSYVDNCICLPPHLYGKRKTLLNFPPIYICMICGEMYTCKCFAGHYDPELVRIDVKCNIGIKDNLCHLCTGRRPSKNSLLPYIELSRAKHPDILDRNTHIDLVRKRFNYPKIGERWASETALHKIITELFRGKEVIFHYRGPELKGLELDIWIPDIKTAIEYQGIQHFEPIKHWGGEAGLEKRKQNDALKRSICQALGYTLIEVPYTAPLEAYYIADLLCGVQNALQIP